MGRFTGKTCRMSTMFILTFALFLLEVTVGYLSHSMALIADSFHMLSDVLALVIAFGCMKISKRTYSSRNTFGWVRAEVLGALVNTVFLVALSFSIILQSIERFFQPEPMQNAIQVLIVGALGLAVNIVGLFLFHGHGGHGHSHGGGGGHGHSHAEKSPANSPHHQPQHHHDCNENTVENGRTVEEAEPELTPEMAAAIGRVRRKSSVYLMTADDFRDQLAQAHPPNPPASLEPNHIDKEKKKMKDKSSGQMNMHGIWLHVLGDAFGSLVVVVNAIVNWQLPNVTVLRNYLDPSLSTIMSCIIIASSIPLLKESAMILLQTVPTHINVQEMKDKLISQFSKQVVDVHDFHIWRLSGNKTVATAHVRCTDELNDYMGLAEKIKAFFHLKGIHSTTVQIELVKDKRLDTKQCALKCPKKTQEEPRHCAGDTCCVQPPTPHVESPPKSPTIISPTRKTSATKRFSFSSGSTLPVTIVEEGPYENNP